MGKENIEDIEDSDYYECILTPKNAPTESKNGITLNGSNDQYVEAHLELLKLFKVKGDHYMINKTEIAILDAPENKPVIVEVKPKIGMSGKVHVKIYGINKNGGATIRISKPKGSGFEYTKILTFKVIRYLLDGMISGEVNHDDIEKMKIKKQSVPKKIAVSKCEICAKTFANQQEFKVHMTEIHKESTDDSGVTAMEIEEEQEIDDKQDVFKESEKTSWEEERIRYLKDIKKENEEMDIENDIEALTRRKDQKVLLKQKKIEEEELEFRESLKMQEIEKKEQEKKRKRQMSIEKKRIKKKTKKEVPESSVIHENKIIDVSGTRYEKKFLEVGLKAEDYAICKVKGDGACGFNSAALNFHLEENLGPYVRRNVNNHIVFHFLKTL